MTCHHPLSAYRVTEKDGSVNIRVLGSVFDYDKFKEIKPYYNANGQYFEPLILPCGQCAGCRLERSRQWAVRCIHEAQMYDQNCFLTLTYDVAHLPDDESLHKEDLQKFWKRLRKSLPGIKIRYFACGEYGSKLSRPHYHAIVFNFWPSDAKLWNIRRGTELFVSPSVAKLWPFGFHSIGHVTFESAAYVARYVLKKVNGSQADFYYDGLEPEYVCMSRKPGIAYDWIRKFSGDVYPQDYIVIRDKFKCRPPKYYDLVYDRDLNGDLEYIKNKRLDQHRDLTADDIKRNEKFTDNIIKNKLKRNMEDIL